MKSTLIALVIALAVAGSLTITQSQTAKVIALEAADANELKLRTQQRDEAQKNLTAIRERINKKYVAKKDGWGSDFEASEDFKYIVPAIGSSTITIGPTSPYYCGGINGATPCTFTKPTAVPVIGDPRVYYTNK